MNYSIIENKKRPNKQLIERRSGMDKPTPPLIVCEFIKSSIVKIFGISLEEMNAQTRLEHFALTWSHFWDSQIVD